MSVELIWAHAAVNVALRPGNSSDFARRELAKAARLDPTAITTRIAVLEHQISLLRAALARETNDGQ